LGFFFPQNVTAVFKQISRPQTIVITLHSALLQKAGNRSNPIRQDHYLNATSARNPNSCTDKAAHLHTPGHGHNTVL